MWVNAMIEINSILFIIKYLYNIIVNGCNDFLEKTFLILSDHRIIFINNKLVSTDCVHFTVF